MAQDADEGAAVYTSVPSFEVLRTALDARLAEHNESNPVMDLVLFQQVSCSSPGGAPVAGLHAELEPYRTLQAILLF